MTPTSHAARNGPHKLKRSGPGHTPAVGEPGVLEALARQAELTPERAGDVEVSYAFPDRATSSGRCLPSRLSTPLAGKWPGS